VELAAEHQDLYTESLRQITDILTAHDPEALMAIMATYGLTVDAGREGSCEAGLVTCSED
jgi:hypothetical protein